MTNYFYRQSAGNSEKGVTLIELIIVVALIAVLAALAIPNFAGADVSFQRQKVSLQLKTYLERARFDSVKRHADNADEMSKVVIYNAVSYGLMQDTNRNGTIENEEVTSTEIGNAAIKIADDNLVFPVTITFNSRGQARAVNGVNALVRPEFVICEKPCSTVTANSKNSDRLAISAAGNVTFIKSGEVYFEPTVAGLTNVSTSSKINQMAQVSR